jgi:hypothetical protein
LEWSYTGTIRNAIEEMMFGEFFRLAMRAPGRRSAFQWAVAVHLFIVLAGFHFAQSLGDQGPVLLGQTLLVTSVVEGATLIGWRLTQLPKSQSLEFFLVSPLQPGAFFMAEAFVGLARLALVILSGLPVLVLCAAEGAIEWVDLPVLLLMPFTWGAITGLGLTCWAYEPLVLRKIGERFMFAGILFYLAVGVLAGENLKLWLSFLPAEVARLLFYGFTVFHVYNPFAVMKDWLDPDTVRSGSVAAVFDRVVWLEEWALLCLGVLLVRSAARLKGHFHERHYKPILGPKDKHRGEVGDWPLSWWAVKRVTEYSGRANLWLAAGFGVMYAAYTVAGPYWPDWLGRRVFEIFNTNMGGIPVVATALIVLAAVPAAFQYGLWDSNAQDRCRRLELLLLTGLGPIDYWAAAAAAALCRGGGYFVVALLLWGAAALAGQMSLVQVLAALSASVILWGIYFVLGFRSFASGSQANGLGSLLTLGVPLLTFGLYRSDLPFLANLLPPGPVYSAAAEPLGVTWMLGPLLWGIAALVIGRRALDSCDADLRRWYDLNHGQRIAD